MSYHAKMINIQRQTLLTGPGDRYLLGHKDARHAAAEIAAQADAEIARLRDENEWLKSQLPSSPEAAAAGGGFDPYNP